MVLTEYVTVDPYEVQTSMSALYPWGTELEVQGVGREEAPDKSGSTRKRKKTSLVHTPSLPHKHDYVLELLCLVLNNCAAFH